MDIRRYDIVQVDLGKSIGSELVAIQDLASDEDAIFTRKYKEEYSNIFDDVKTVASICDDFVKQLRCFTEKQDIYDIKPIGKQKIILLRE